MTTPPPPSSGPGMTAPPPSSSSGVLDFLFAPRRSKRVAPASQVGKATREREIRGYRNANPGATRQQAARATAAQRRRGYVPETVRTRTATPEQARRAENYQRRADRTRNRGRYGGTYDTRQVPIVSTTGMVLEFRSNMPTADINRAWSHYFAVVTYLESGNARYNRLGQSYFSGAEVRLRQWGQAPLETRLVRTFDGRVWELETNLQRLNQMGLTLDLSPSEILQVTGSAPAVEAAA